MSKRNSVRKRIGMSSDNPHNPGSWRRAEGAIDGAGILQRF